MGTNMYSIHGAWTTPSISNLLLRFVILYAVQRISTKERCGPLKVGTLLKSFRMPQNFQSRASDYVLETFSPNMHSVTPNSTSIKAISR